MFVSAHLHFKLIFKEESKVFFKWASSLYFFFGFVCFVLMQSSKCTRTFLVYIVKTAIVKWWQIGHGWFILSDRKQCKKHRLLRETQINFIKWEALKRRATTVANGKEHVPGFFPTQTPREVDRLIEVIQLCPKIFI